MLYDCVGTGSFLNLGVMRMNIIPCGFLKVKATSHDQALPGEMRFRLNIQLIRKDI